MISAQTGALNMWTTEHSIDTTVGPEAIWRAWADVAGWGRWNGDIESIELTGPFAQGSAITMRPHGQEPVQLRLAEVVPGERFVDEADLDGTIVRTMHRIERRDDGCTRVVYRLEASGPAADAIGPAVSADFEDTLEALVEYAQR
jgi:uncharacterized protein YndB with AHSA1/START domain